MENLPVKAMTAKALFEGDNVKNKFKELLGQKAQGFITSVLQIVNSSNDLMQADPMTVYFAAAQAATLDLPINQNLGFAWIIAYNNKGKKEAQFQIGYKGFTQLALRTGQYLRINAVEVYANQFKKWNRLTEELEADFEIEGEGEVVGFAAFFRLVNGFEKTIYWSKKEVDNHAKKFSKSYGRDFSTWTKDFNAMAKKTVLKSALSRWGILSIELQKAIVVDQAIIRDADGEEVFYPDNLEETPEDKGEKATQDTENKLKKKDLTSQVELKLEGKQ